MFYHNFKKIFFQEKPIKYTTNQQIFLSCKIERYRKTKITNDEIDKPDYAFSKDDQVNNWNKTENRDVIISTLNKLDLTPFKVHAVPGHMEVAHGK